jgi:predicted NUDIX family NTP pyrophosphohydrolase
MPRLSAGLLLYRRIGNVINVFLVHPGGPLWARKDLETWSIPKGLVDGDEEVLEAAKREFHEETSFTARGPFLPLTPIKLGSRKIIHAWAIEGDCDAREMKSNNFTMEWPPHSGQRRTYPEADRGDWFTLEEARKKISKGQIGLIDELQNLLS